MNYRFVDCSCQKWQMNLVKMAVTTEATVEGLHLLDDAGRFGCIIVMTCEDINNRPTHNDPVRRCVNLQLLLR